MRGSNECTVFHCLGRARAVSGPRHAEGNRRENKRAADDTPSGMQKQNRDCKKMPQGRKK